MNAIQRVARFKKQKRITMTAADGSVLRLTFREAELLRSYLESMLRGDLIEVTTKRCGCMERICE